MEFYKSMCDTPSMTSTTTDVRARGLGAPYWRLWTSAALSNLADGVLKVALPLMALAITRSPLVIAGLALAMTVPWLLFALPAGVVTDRYDRRLLMLGANTVRALLLAGLGLVLVFDAGTVAVLYVVALAAGTAETVYDTAAQTMVPSLVHHDRLPRANGRLYAAELTANEFVGPPLAGVLVAVGAVAAVSTPAALWVVAVLALLLVRGSFRAGPPAGDAAAGSRRATLRTDIAEGMRFLWRHRLLRTFTVMVGAFNLASSATMAVLVLYAVGPGSAMGLGEQAYGWLLSAFAAGSLLGSFLAEPCVRVLGRARTLVVTFALAAVALGVPAMTVRPLVVGAAFLVGGAGIVVANIVMVSLRQRITPDRLLGRVGSSHRLLAYGTKPLGAVVGGVLAEFVGLRAVFAVMGVLALAVLLGMVRATDAAMDAAETVVPHG
jgi:MFS family permease